MQFAITRQSLDRCHPTPVRIDGKHQARVHRNPIDQDDTGSAVALTTPLLRAREIEPLSQKFNERSPGFHLHPIALIVHFKLNGNTHGPSSPRSAMAQALEIALDANTFTIAFR
jgi:hypothetical protein